MTLNIKLTAAKAGSGVNFNTYLTAQFNGFTPHQMPFFLEQTGSTETTQMWQIKSVFAKQGQDKWQKLTCIHAISMQHEHRFALAYGRNRY